MRVAGSTAARAAVVLGAVAACQALWLGAGVTTDLGDGVTHYLAANLAFRHPELLLDPWCKPAFTLLAAPFAWLGFSGMIFFQTLVSLLTLGLVWRISTLCGLPAAWLAPLLLLLQPGFVSAIFTGLTEPLFAAFVVLALWLGERRKWGWAYLVLGITPFIRAEGWVLGLWWALLAARRRQGWLLLPLALAHVVYAIIGWLVVFHDPLWMFHNNPYWISARPYGHGDWGHYFRQYPWVAGAPLAYLTVGATASLALRCAARRAGLLGHAGGVDRDEDERWLLYYAGTFVAYFAAHVVFWRFGLFNSFGMARVLVAVLPVAALVVSREWHLLSRAVAPGLPRRWPTWAFAAVVTWLAATDDSTAQRMQGLVTRTEQQRVIDESIVHVHRMAPDLQATPVYFGHPYAALALGLDSLDPRTAVHTSRLESHPIVSGALVVWDSWFSVVEHGVTAADLEALALEDRHVIRSDPASGERFEVVVGRLPGARASPPSP